MDSEPPLDEVHLVLRVGDPTLASQLRERMETECMGEVTLQFQEPPHERCGVLRLDGRDPTPCKLLDLPCLTECYKTLNNDTFFKVGDIGQMLYVGSDAHSANDKLDSGLSPAAQGIRTHWQRREAAEGVPREALRKLRDDFLRVLQAESENAIVEFLEVPEDATDADILSGRYGVVGEPEVVRTSAAAAPPQRPPLAANPPHRIPPPIYPPHDGSAGSSSANITASPSPVSPLPSYAPPPPLPRTPVSPHQVPPIPFVPPPAPPPVAAPVPPFGGPVPPQMFPPQMFPFSPAYQQAPPSPMLPFMIGGPQPMGFPSPFMTPMYPMPQTQQPWRPPQLPSPHPGRLAGFQAKPPARPPPSPAKPPPQSPRTPTAPPAESEVQRLQRELQSLTAEVRSATNPSAKARLVGRIHALKETLLGKGGQPTS